MRSIALSRPFAVFSDVHGNLPALEAILADIEARGITEVLCLGDLVGRRPIADKVAQAQSLRNAPALDVGEYRLKTRQVAVHV